MKGIIKTESITPLKNKLVIKHYWWQKDHTDSEYCEKTYQLLESDYEKIISANLIEREVEFELIELIVGRDTQYYAKIIWPSIKYSEQEVHALVLGAWHDGWNNADANYYGRKIAHQMPDNFWEENKKK